MTGITKQEQTNRKISKSMNKLTPDNIKKLETMAGYDANITETCFYLDISLQTYYNWMKREPKLFERLSRLRAKPTLKARETVVNRLSDNYENAMDYLERKESIEFAKKQKVEHSGKITYNISELLDQAEKEDKK